MQWIYALELLVLIVFAWRIERNTARTANEIALLRGGDEKEDGGLV